MEELDFILDTANEAMEQSIVHLEKEMLNIRAGKANPVMLSGVKVDYYGTASPWLFLILNWVISPIS